MCGMRGCVVHLLARTHSWESRVAFIDGCILILVCAREGKGLSKGTICCAAAGFSKARAQGTAQEHVFTAAFVPVAYPLLHHEFSPVEFQGFPYPGVEKIIPQKLSDTAAVSD